MRDFAELLTDRGELDEAERYYRGAIDAGDILAIVGLASMLRKRDAESDAVEAAALAALLEAPDAEGIDADGGLLRGGGSRTSVLDH